MRFTVHRPGNPVASPCSHRPPGGDICGSVDVGVCPIPAGRATESRLALTRRNVHLPTTATFLRGKCGVDSLYSTRSLLFQPGEKSTPPRRKDRSVQSGFLSDFAPWLRSGACGRPSHSRDPQVLDSDQVEATSKVGAGFLDPVSTTIALPRTELGKRELASATSIGTLFGSAEPALKSDQPASFLTRQSWAMQQLAGRKSGRHDDATIDSNDLAIARGVYRVRLRRQGDMPMPDSIERDAVGLDPFADRSRPAKFDPADLGNSHPTSATVEPLYVMSGDPDLPKPLVDPRLAPSRLSVRAVEEVLHGLGEVTKRLLLHGLRAVCEPRVLSPRLGQLSTLFEVARPGFTTWTPIPLLFDREVPDVSGMSTVLQQLCFLLSGRKQSISRHEINIVRTADKTGSCVSGWPGSTRSRPERRGVNRSEVL